MGIGGHELTSEWSFCLIAGTTPRTEVEDVADDKRIRIELPEVREKLLDCTKKYRRYGGYINGDCVGCLLKQRFHLESL
jgi:hypothetical protein